MSCQQVRTPEKDRLEALNIAQMHKQLTHIGPSAAGVRPRLLLPVMSAHDDVIM